MGVLIEFYRPVKKPRGIPMEPVEHVIKLLSEHQADVKELQIFLVDKEDKIGHIGTLVDDDAVGRFMQRFGFYRGTV
jgi:hypothetical protein